MKHCFFCKDEVEESQLIPTVVESPGPHPGCAEFAGPEYHPVDICKGCDEKASCDCEAGCYECWGPSLEDFI